jgi:hypothetical protein
MRDWAVGFGGGEEAHCCRRWRAPRVVVRLLCTQDPACQVHDMWGLGSHARGWAVVFGGDEETHYHGRRFAPRVAVRLLRTRRPTHQLYDLRDRAPVS